MIICTKNSKYRALHMHSYYVNLEFQLNYRTLHLITYYLEFHLESSAVKFLLVD